MEMEREMKMSKTEKEELKLIIEAFKQQQKTIDQVMKALIMIETSHYVFPLLKETLEYQLKHQKKSKANVKKHRPKF